MTDNGGRLAAATGLRTELIGAIADLAIAARAGTLLKAYQREWSWVDKQNYEDAVDADEFNEAFHGIEREFDKLAQILAQGAGGLPAPDWDSGEITLTNSQPWVLCTHDLNSTDLLVDMKMVLSVNTKNSLILSNDGEEVDVNAFSGLEIEKVWQSGPTLHSPHEQGAVFSAMYVLPNQNQIVLGGGDANMGILGEGLTVHALVWKW